MNDLVENGIALSSRDIKARVNLIQEVMRNVMQDGTHYGVIPGCPKPSLYKAGAEKLAATFQINVESSVEDLSTSDEKRYRVTCVAYSASGVKLGSAVGECSSGEEKYKWRKPVCKEEFDGAEIDRRRKKWQKKKDKSGKQIWNKDLGDYEYEEIMQVRTEPADQANTIIQMADKRAYVAVIRKVTAASDIFTQDVEDTGVPAGEDAPAFKKPQPKAEAFNSADFREMKSKFPGKCGKCEADIPVGTDILYNGKLKKAYHPECLNPATEPEHATAAEEGITPAILKNLERMAKAAKVNLIDRIGSEGCENLEQVSPELAKVLLKEFAEIIDDNSK